MNKPQMVTILQKELSIHSEQQKAFYSFDCDFAPAGYFILLYDGKIKKVNQSGALILNEDISTLKNRNIKRYISADTLQIFNEFIARLFDNKLRHCCKIDFVVGNSTKEIHIEGSIYEIDMFIISAVDANDKNQNMELLLKGNLFKQIFETSKDGIVILNEVSGHISDANITFCEISGYKREELLDKNILNFCASDNQADILAELRNNHTIKQYKLRNRMNKLVDVEIVSNSFLFGSEMGIQCNMRDISERKRSETELKENESRLKDLNAAKDKFFSIISHDLRSPFNCIIGYCDLLIERVDKQDYRKVEKYSRVIHEASWRAMNLLTDLTDWSRSQTGKLEFHPESININSLVNETLECVLDSAEQKEIQLEKTLPLNISVYADKSMLKTILRNLVNNAIKFTHPGGKVIIAARNRPGEVRFSVIDNGIGISAEVIRNLFRIDKSTSTPGTNFETGSGLGLLICKEFVEFHKGQIWVVSQPGEGSKFNFTIPNR
jgi:PAS domain S-box-containing protein